MMKFNHFNIFMIGMMLGIGMFAMACMINSMNDAFASLDVQIEFSQIALFYLVGIGIFMVLKSPPVYDIKNRTLWILLGKSCSIGGCQNKSDLCYIPTNERLCGHHASLKIKGAA